MKCRNAQLDDDVFVGAATYFFVQFGRCVERTRTLSTQSGKFRIDGEKTRLFNHIVELFQYFTKIYENSRIIRLGYDE